MKKILFVIISLFFGIISFSQSPNSEGFNAYINDPYINIVPPTPNGANFAQYGNTPVNTSSGLPNISIPIYTIEADGTQVPITLTYDASGVKVDDISSTVGLKWTLNAGGAIVRTVKDRDDFTNQNSPFGWVWGNSLSRYDDYINGIDPSQDYTDTDFQIFFQERITRDDNFPDDFSYNFLNFSGRIMFKPNGEILKGKFDELEINGGLGSFEAVDLMGNIYRFTDEEYNNFKTRQLNYTYNDATDIEWDYYLVGWFLSNIETKNGKSIDFSYESYNGYEYSISPVTQSIVTANYCGEVCSFYQPPNCIGYDGPNWKEHNVFMGTEVFYDTSTKLIHKIFTDNVEVEFVYLDGSILNSDGSSTIVSGWSKRVDKIIIKDKIKGKQKEFNFKYGVFNGDQRLKLTEIQEKGFDGTAKAPYKFYYNTTALPEVGSKSKDYKGYFNGKVNQSLIPFSAAFINNDYGYNRDLLGDRFYDIENLKAGVLTKIEYPTGGSTEFEYEANAFGDSSEIEIKSKGTFITNYDNGNVRVYGDGTPQIYFGQNKYIYSNLVEINDPLATFKIQNSGDCVNCSCSCPEVTRLILYKYNGNITDLPEEYFNPGNIDPLSPVLNVPFTNNDIEYVSFDSSQGNGVYIATLLIGDRDKYSNDYDLENDHVQISLNWFENVKDNNGNILYRKNYFGGLRVHEIIDYDFGSTSYNHKRYSYLDAYLEGSGITFSIDDFRQNLANQTTLYSNPVPAYYGRHMDGYAYTKIKIEDIMEDSVKGGTVEFYDVNFDFNTVNGGDILKRIVFDKDGDVLEIMENDYISETMETLTFHKPTYLGWNDFYYTLTELCPFGGVPIDIPAFNKYSPTDEYFEIKKTLSVSRNTKFLLQNDTNQPLTTIKTYKYSNNLLVESETTDTRYTALVDTSGNISGYNISDSEGDVIEARYHYVKEFHPVIPLTVPDGLPVSKEVFDLKDPSNGNDDLKVLGQYFEYDNVGNIKNTYRYNKGGGTNSGPSYVPQNYELDVAYLTDQGKPTQVRGQDGVITSYIWGYNKQYPVAEMVGLSYANAIAAPGFNLAIANASSDAQTIQDEIRKIRVAYPTAQITTYTYSPLVGISSITDPKGMRVDYIYDGLGRLKYIKDQEGNIVGKNEYHYKN